VSRHRAAFFGLAAAIVVADQLSKAWIVAGFPFGEPVEVLGAWVRIWFVANNGALFGLFRAGFPFGEPVEVLGAWVRIWFVANNGALFGLFRDQALVFAALSVAVMALIVWYHGRAVAGSGWLATLALGLLLGGAVGNFIDRIRLGHVVDFVDMGFPGGWRFYTWNLADAAISTSILLLLVMAVLPPGRREAGGG